MRRPALRLALIGALTVASPGFTAEDPPSLPVPWSHRVIGAVAVKGDARHADGTFTVTGTRDVWGKADGFHFAYRTLVDRYVVAPRAIRPGDEITCDHCINGDGDTAWDCSCGSPACRGRLLSGFFHIPEEVQVRYLALLEDWFVAEHREGVEILKRRVEEGLR